MVNGKEIAGLEVNQMTNGMIRFTHWALASGSFIIQPVIRGESKVLIGGIGKVSELKELMEVTLDGTTHTTA